MLRGRKEEGRFGDLKNGKNGCLDFKEEELSVSGRGEWGSIVGVDLKMVTDVKLGFGGGAVASVFEFFGVYPNFSICTYFLCQKK